MYELLWPVYGASVYLHISEVHLSIFSTSSIRDCWNLLLTVGAWYFLVTVLLFLM